MNRLLRKTLRFFVVGTALSTSTLKCAGRSSDAPSPVAASELSQIWQEAFSLPPGKGQLSTAKTTTTSYPADQHLRSNEPHPAVVRVIVPEEGATSYGSGTLVDLRDQYGLVITNWHVVRDAQGMVEVVFPGGFKSKARALKVDPDWDLAALVVWRPPVEPVPIASTAPKPGDPLTICGYGQGMYRSATGRCTQYYAPRLDFPRHMVELDVEARQGDSGGPIFNRQGELAGVLFGAGQGTTLGSFGGRVENFLATLAPDIGKRAGVALASNAKAPDWRPPAVRPEGFQNEEALAPPPRLAEAPAARGEDSWQAPQQHLAAMWPNDPAAKPKIPKEIPRPLEATHVSWKKNDPFEQAKNVLAAIGLVSLAVLILRAAR